MNKKNSTKILLLGDKFTVIKNIGTSDEKRFHSKKISDLCRFIDPKNINKDSFILNSTEKNLQPLSKDEIKKFMFIYKSYLEQKVYQEVYRSREKLFESLEGFSSIKSFEIKVGVVYDEEDGFTFEIESSISLAI